MIWIYYVAYIIIFGAEITRAYAHRAETKGFRAATAEAAEAAESDGSAPPGPEQAAGGPGRLPAGDDRPSQNPGSTP